MVEEVEGDKAVSALIRAYVACKVALDALPDLPESLRDAVEPPVQELCRVVGPALERARPEPTAS
ncbi:MAG TPA: hypothetical protein VGK79_10240 [Gaiellaceae bacterium]